MATRIPSAETPARIEAIETLPVFHRLAGRRVILAGASEGALWKAELLLAAGAELHVFAPEAAEHYLPLTARGAERGALHLHARHWQPDDLAGAAIAIAEAEGDAEAAAFAEAARAAGIPVNIIDKPEFCDFQFGSIVNRSPLLIAISTDGAAPVFGQAIRMRIEALLPRGLKAWAEAAKAWRPAISAREWPFALRRTFWERFSRRALAAPEAAPDETDFASLLAETADTAGEPAGRISFVGAGPGDPELLTLKAVRALQNADVILFDDLVSSEVLDLARREAKRVRVGKRGHGPSCKQEDINALMTRLARQGRHVVRLKAGDPGVFGRLTEEIDACRAAGIAHVIVPGITSAQGAAASLGVSLTERKHARRLQFVTGHGEDGKLPTDLADTALADPAASTIVYMPKRTLAALAARAIAAGLPGDTPALAVINATRPDETRVIATIATLAGAIAASDRDGPMLVMIGAAFRHVATQGETREEAREEPRSHAARAA